MFHLNQPCQLFIARRRCCEFYLFLVRKTKSFCFLFLKCSSFHFLKLCALCITIDCKPHRADDFKIEFGKFGGKYANSNMKNSTLSISNVRIILIRYIQIKRWTHLLIFKNFHVYLYMSLNNIMLLYSFSGL